MCDSCSGWKHVPRPVTRFQPSAATLPFCSKNGRDMAQRDLDLYDSKPMRGLLAAEAQALAPELQRCAGTYALQVSAIARDLPASPMLDRWVHLHLDGGHCRGDLHTRLDEPLPFLD